MVYDELLKAVTDNEQKDFRELIEKAVSWDYFYNLSPIRANLINWLPIGKEDKVLEIGAQCGALTGALCTKAGEVVAIEESEAMSKVNEARNSKAGNASFLVGSFESLEAKLAGGFTYIILVGYKRLTAATLKLAKKHLAADGRIIIACENKLGLKYFAGCKEETTGQYFGGIEGKDSEAILYSKSGLTEMLTEAGVNSSDYAFYYPYPDLYFPNTIFSDEWGPKTGELYQNLRNFDDERFVLFDETKAFDTLIREGKFDEFSNAYMVIIGSEISTKYSRFSNDRADEYCVRTDICIEDGKYLVYKSADTSLANGHIDNMLTSYECLSDKYADTGLTFNKITRVEDTVGKIKCEFVKGYTLEELLDNALYQNDKDEFIKLFNRYTSWVMNAKSEGIFDYDLIFPNIIMNDSHAVAIDYEWTKAEYGKDKLIARALYCYIQGNEGRAKLKEWIDISKWQDLMENARGEEIAFQKEVQNGRLALYEIRYILGNKAYTLDTAIERIHSTELPIRIYTDCGEGIQESTAYNIEAPRRTGDVAEFDIHLNAQVKKLRIDPGDNPCLMKINSILVDGEDKTEEFFSFKNTGIRYHNGKKVGKWTYLFKKFDPHIAFAIECTKDGKEHDIRVNMTVNPISEEISKYL